MDRSDVFEVDAVSTDPVDAYVADDQHAQLAFAFCFRTQKPG